MLNEDGNVMDALIRKSASMILEALSGMSFRDSTKLRSMYQTWLVPAETFGASVASPGADENENPLA